MQGLPSPQKRKSEINRDILLLQLAETCRNMIYQRKMVIRHLSRQQWAEIKSELKKIRLKSKSIRGALKCIRAELKAYQIRINEYRSRLRESDQRFKE